MDLDFDIIFVPQGSEYQAICRGIKFSRSDSLPQVLAIPMGVNALESYLKAKDWQPEAKYNILVMGLCGSLSPQYQVGDIVSFIKIVFFLSLPHCNLDILTHNLHILFIIGYSIRLV